MSRRGRSDSNTKLQPAANSGEMATMTSVLAARVWPMDQRNSPELMANSRATATPAAPASATAARARPRLRHRDQLPMVIKKPTPRQNSSVQASAPTSRISSASGVSSSTSARAMSSPLVCSRMLSTPVLQRTAAAAAPQPARPSAAARAGGRQALAGRRTGHYTTPGRSVAQPGRALPSGGRGRAFESPHSDQFSPRTSA